MEKLYSDLTISMSDFKKNPAKVLREAGDRPVAVLNHNKAAFYLVEPGLFETMLEDLEDARILPLVRVRQADREKAIVVDIDRI
ncbi:MAG: type II toxin-antitoxin system Phd/YefM family antitoxin [Rectinemataceae bacterium]|jgi:antitoxin StbD